MVKQTNAHILSHVFIYSGRTPPIDTHVTHIHTQTRSLTHFLLHRLSKTAGWWILLDMRKQRRERLIEEEKTRSFLPLPSHIPSWFWQDHWEIDVPVFFIPSVTAQRGTGRHETSQIPKWWMYTSASSGRRSKFHISRERRLILKIIWNFAWHDIGNLYSNCMNELNVLFW